MGMVALLSANFQHLEETVFSVSLKSDRVSIITSLRLSENSIFQEFLDHEWLRDCLIMYLNKLEPIRGSQSAEPFES